MPQENVNWETFKCNYEQSKSFLICNNDYSMIVNHNIMLKVSRFCEKSFEISAKKNIAELAKRKWLLWTRSDISAMNKYVRLKTLKMNMKYRFCIQN